MVRLGHREDVGLVADEADEPVGEERVKQGERQGDEEAPQEQEPHRAAQLLTVVGTSETPHKRLACISETIREIGEDVEELHQDHVDREHVVAELGRLVVEVGDAQHEQDAADHEVGVDREETFQLVGLQEYLFLYGHQVFAVFGEQKCHGDGQAAILRDDRAQGHAAHAHAHRVDEQDAQHDVHHVGDDGDGHGDGGVLHPDVPAVEGIEAEHRRRRPDAHAEVGDGEGQHFLAAVEQLQAEPFHEALQRKHQNGGNQRDAEGAIERMCHLGLVARAVGLRREARGARPHEAEHRVHHAEDGAAQSDGSDVGHAVLMPHQHHVHEAEQRHGDVADDVRDGQLQDGTVEGVVSYLSGFSIEVWKNGFI